MEGNDELEAEDLPWAMLEATPVPLQPADPSESHLIVVPVPPFLRASPPISVLLDAREGCGGHLWQAALELCSHLDTHPAWADRDFKSLRVLELGAGTGLAGMYAARRGATVLCTDLAVMLPILRRNVELNFASGDPRVTVAEFCWGTDVSVLGKEPFDLILASDCVYLEGAFEPLLKSLEALMQPGGPSTLLLSYQHRRKAESAFFRRLWKHFSLVPAESRHGPRVATSPSPPSAAPPTTGAAMGKSHKVQILSLKRSPATIST
jgi:hypothetical protein